MLTKDIIALGTNTEFVIAHPNAYVHKNERKVDTISERKSLTVKLHSTNTYAESNYTHSDASHPSFKPTITEKVKFFLVHYNNGTEEVYRTVKAQDFIATRPEVEQAWAVARVKQAEAEAKQQAEEAIVASLREQAEATEQAVQVAVKENVVAMFGRVLGEQIGTPWIRSGVKIDRQPDGTLKGHIETTGEVRIPVDAFLRLAERWADLQDA